LITRFAESDHELQLQQLASDFEKNIHIPNPISRSKYKSQVTALPEKVELSDALVWLQRGRWISDCNVQERANRNLIKRNDLGLIVIFERKVRDQDERNVEIGRHKRLGSPVIMDKVLPFRRDEDQDEQADAGPAEVRPERRLVWQLVAVYAFYLAAIEEPKIGYQNYCPVDQDRDRQEIL
jgi:hypothetical protein